MYDRIVRAGFWTSTRVNGLHSDSHRLLYLLLLARSDDFGCQSGNLDELIWDARRATQIDAVEALGSAIDRMSTLDLVRPYVVGIGANGQRYELPERWEHQQDQTGLYLPRFASGRSWSARKFAPSPWCNAAGEVYGPVRRRLDGTQSAPRDQVKRSTNTGERQDNVSTDVAHRSADNLVSESPIETPVISQNQQLALEPSSDLTTDNVSPESVSRQSYAGEGWRGVKENDGGNPTNSKRRPTKLAEDWTIADEWIDWAVGFALDQGHHVARSTILRVAESMHDWARSNGETSLDWRARWRTWFRREDLAKLAQRKPDDEPDFMARAR